MSVTSVLKESQPQKPNFAPGVYRYIGSAEASRGEIVLINDQGSGMVIHSVCPNYPVGYMYGDSKAAIGATLERIASATIEFKSP